MQLHVEAEHTYVNQDSFSYWKVNTNCCYDNDTHAELSEIHLGCLQ
jgi:hypothetical protein